MNDTQHKGNARMEMHYRIALKSYDTDADTMIVELHDRDHLTGESPIPLAFMTFAFGESMQFDVNVSDEFTSNYLTQARILSATADAIANAYEAAFDSPTSAFDQGDLSIVVDAI